MHILKLLVKLVSVIASWPIDDEEDVELDESGENQEDGIHAETDEADTFVKFVTVAGEDRVEQY